MMQFASFAFGIALALAWAMGRAMSWTTREHGMTPVAAFDPFTKDRGVLK